MVIKCHQIRLVNSRLISSVRNMHCIRNLKRNCISVPVRLILKANYSRRSNENTSSYEIIKSNGESVDDLDNAVFEPNPNWELLTPRGFRFYLPGSIGPGWLDASTIAQVETHSMVLPDEEEFLDECTRKIHKNQKAKHRGESAHSVLQCLAQECPMLLKKDIMELFPGCLEVMSPQLTIVTLSQKMYPKTARWSKEVETEKLAKYFVLAASDICNKLKMAGYWADFINPFSGQPYNNLLKNNTLYKIDERFRCLGFKVDSKNHCKVITYEEDARNFVGNIYTTAPSKTSFLKELMHD